jgi:ABC-type enterobactin transport system permease subunit
MITLKTELSRINNELTGARAERAPSEALIDMLETQKEAFEQAITINRLQGNKESYMMTKYVKQELTRHMLTIVFGLMIGLLIAVFAFLIGFPAIINMATGMMFIAALMTGVLWSYGIVETAACLLSKHDPTQEAS